MSLQSVINSKNLFSERLLNSFDKNWAKLSPAIQRGIEGAFRSGNITKDAITQIFAEGGFDDLTGRTAAQFAKMLGYSKQISTELGYDFIVNSRNISLFEQISELNIDRMLGVREQIALDMRRFAIESIVEKRNVQQIRAGLEGLFEKMGRNLNAEIFTGIQSYGRSIDLVTMQNVGIEKFVYIGPNDGKTRDVCRNTLSNEKQQTGWTYDEIQNSETPFIEAGGFNCRHQWVAYNG